MSFLNELRRRNVFRIAGLYLVGAWLVVQVTSTILPLFDAPAWLSRSIVIALAIGFIPALVFAWAFELTPEGLKRDAEVERAESITPQTGQQLNRLIMVMLALALAYFAFDKFVLAPQREAAERRQASEDLEIARKESRSESMAESAGDKSIAVLPFVNMSPDKDQEYFADGIAEELLNLLAKVPELRVIARTSSFSFKGQNLNVPEIARRLSVAHVLEGSVRKSGNHVRVTAQLIDARSDKHLWSGTYDRPLDNIFAVQDEIAADVVSQLKVKLLGDVPKARTTDPEAYAFYLQAVQLGRLRTVEAYQQSDALYRQVLAIDPRYAPAWSGLSSNFANKVNLGLMSGREGNTKAREAAMQALAIDERYAPAHARLGLIAMYGDNDLAAAARHIERARALDPAGLGVLNSAALLLVSLGRLDEARALAEDVVRRDPVSVSALFNMGLYQRYAGQLDAAAATYRTVLSLVPNRGNAHAELGNVLLLQGDAKGALAEIEQETSASWKMYGLPMAYHALGRTAESDAALAALIAKYEKDAPYNIAYVHAFRGDAEQAFAWLDKAAEYGDSGLADIVSENLFDRVRADPRWLPFLRRIGKAPDQLAAVKFDLNLPK